MTQGHPIDMTPEEKARWFAEEWPKLRKGGVAQAQQQVKTECYPHYDYTYLGTEDCTECVQEFLAEYHKLATGQATDRDVREMADKVLGMVKKMKDVTQSERTKGEQGGKSALVDWANDVDRILNPIERQCRSAKYSDQPRVEGVVCIEKFAHLSHEENYWLAEACGCPPTYHNRRGSTPWDMLIQKTFDCLAGEHQKPVLWYESEKPEWVGKPI